MPLDRPLVPIYSKEELSLLIDTLKVKGFQRIDPQTWIYYWKKTQRWCKIEITAGWDMIVNFNDDEMLYPSFDTVQQTIAFFTES